MVVLAFVHGAMLVVVPSAPLIALGVWWNSNTISHNFIHHPFFRRRSANVLFGAYLSVLLGIPQAWWRARHLAHHGIDGTPRVARGELALQTALVLGSWTALVTFSSAFFFTVYLPGYAAGLVLCGLHGHYEHVRGTVSHYGALYNRLCFNDGYHVEHHRYPGVPWRRLPAYRSDGAIASPWPAPLRWMESASLEGLERIALGSPFLQRFLLATHTRALRSLCTTLPETARVAIVGGGLFPRTALVLKTLLPSARLTIIDANAEHLECARCLLHDQRIEYVHARYAAGLKPGGTEFDAVIIPLDFHGNREALYANPPARAVVVHDWIWRKRGVSRVVSPLLLKRINVVGQ